MDNECVYIYIWLIWLIYIYTWLLCPMDILMIGRHWGIDNDHLFFGMLFSNYMQ